MQMVLAVAPPAQRIFTIPDDNCQEYAVLPGWKTALVYDDVLEETTLANGTVVETWKQTENLKLPIMCMYCGAQTTSFVYYFG